MFSGGYPRDTYRRCRLPGPSGTGWLPNVDGPVSAGSWGGSTTEQRRFQTSWILYFPRWFIWEKLFRDAIDKRSTRTIYVCTIAGGRGAIRASESARTHTGQSLNVSPRPEALSGLILANTVDLTQQQVMRLYGWRMQREHRFRDGKGGRVVDMAEW